MAKEHLWLSPEYRIIADAPGVDTFVYDGAGTVLVLPKDLPSLDSLPLIVVGKCKTLRLQNVRIANVGSLAACLQLGAGAKVLLEASDGVQLLESEDELMLDKRYQRYMLSLQAALARAAAGQQGQRAAQRDYVMDVDVVAVGGSFHLVDTESAGRQAGSGQLPRNRSGMVRTMSSSMLSDDGASAGPASGPMPGSVEEERLLRMLALQLDLSLHYTAENNAKTGSKQVGRGWQDHCTCTCPVFTLYNA